MLLVSGGKPARAALRCLHQQGLGHRAIVYRHQLPTSANAPIAVFGNTVLIPAGGPRTSSSGGGNPQLVAYTVR